MTTWPMALCRCILPALRSSSLSHPSVPVAGTSSSARQIFSLNSLISCQTGALDDRRSWSQCRHASGMSKAAKRLEKLGLGPDGTPLPMPNYKKIYPRMYKVLMVNQDGSTYTVRHRFPHKIITLPLDLTTLSPEQLAEREKIKQAAKSRVYVEEEDLEDTWEHDRYKHLIK